MMVGRASAAMLVTSLLMFSATPLVHGGLGDPARVLDEVLDGAPSLMEWGEPYADAFDAPEVPDGLRADELAAFLLEELHVQGRTPMQWVEWVQQDASSPLANAPLTQSVARLYAAMGIPLAPLDLVDMEAQAAALDPATRAAFEDLAAVVVDAFVAQQALVPVIEARFLAATSPLDVIVTPEERDAMAARAQAIASTAQALELALPAPAMPAWLHIGTAADPPLFTDPEGLIVLGGTGDGIYTQEGLFPDPVLLVDPAGNDRYENSAGGADPTGLLANTVGGGNSIPVSVVVDLGGDDAYVWDGGPAVVQGAGAFGGIGILVDTSGADEYAATMTRTTSGPLSLCILYYCDPGAQGYGYGGVGLMIDGTGDDAYSFDFVTTEGRCFWGFAQGFGAAGGLGVAWDAMGDDSWLASGIGLKSGGCWGPGTTRGFIGMYNQGTGLFGGVGIILDTGLGNDHYDAYLDAVTTDYYAQGFGAFGGVGIMYEDGGDDFYSAVETASNPHIVPLLNCAYGTASYGGTGVFVDVLGNDYYFGDTISPYAAFTMNEGFGGLGAAVGVFFDGAGEDDHIMLASGNSQSMVAGRGDGLSHGEAIGAYVDAGGEDTYVGPPFTYTKLGDGAGPNESVWSLGVDL